MIIQRFASDGQRFGFIWRRHCGGKNGLSRWLWVGNVVTTVVYFIGNRSAEILIDALPGSLKCYRPTNRYFLLEEASVGEAQLADESTRSAASSGSRRVVRPRTSVEPSRGFTSGCRVRSTTACAGRWWYESTGSYFAG